MKYNFFAFAYISFFIVLATILIRSVILNPGDKTLVILAFITVPLYVYFAIKGTIEINRMKRMHSNDGSWE